jgi:hypothetical protein
MKTTGPSIKYDQIISLTEASVKVPSLSCSVIRKNMLMHNSPSKTIGLQHKRCIMRQVRQARKNLTKKQLGCFEIEDSFGNLTYFCMRC